MKITSIFGTRPEAIKMFPVLRELERRGPMFHVCTVNTAQHTDLLDPLIEYFGVSVDHSLGVQQQGQSLDQLLSRLLMTLDPVLDEEGTEMVMVQGDTTSALAGALAAHHRRIPIVHIEAGLRTDNKYSPFPEEMNRRLITRLATYHMAATPLNVQNLLNENIPEDSIFMTGNPVVDALKTVLAASTPSEALQALLKEAEGRRLMVLTLHRRENFGDLMRSHLIALREFVDRHDDVMLVFPVHPNPQVREACGVVGDAGSRFRFVEPMLYPDFVQLLSRAWLIVSDSGGVQEEAPTVGKPLFVLRENTERPEVIHSKLARLAGGSGHDLAGMLEEVATDDSWIRSVRSIENPFGKGDAARRIADAIGEAVSQKGRLRVVA